MKDRYFDFGQRRFGPFLYGFVRWLKKELVSGGFEKVFFFSRDGYMLQKAFDSINDTEIRSQYVYVSRSSLRKPLLHYCDGFENSLQYLSWERYISYGKLLNYYGFTECERDKYAIEHDCNLETVIPFDDVKKNLFATQLYKENQSIINNRSAEQDKILLEYTEVIGMRGKFAIVDIGWRGNMQYYLDLFMEKHGIAADYEGFYIGMIPNVPLVTTTHGYVFSERKPKKFKSMMSFCGVSEKLLQGFEGSTSGYSRADNDIVPVLLPYEYESDKDVKKAIIALQNGALSFVRKANAKDLQATDEQLTAPLIQFGTKPTADDVKMFARFFNTDGTKVYYTAQKPLYRYRPKEFIHALGESPWKTGFLKSAFKLPLPYFTMYKMLRK